MLTRLTMIILHYMQSIMHMKLISYMVIITHFQKRIKFCSEKQKNWASTLTLISETHEQY